MAIKLNFGKFPFVSWLPINQVDDWSLFNLFCAILTVTQIVKFLPDVNTFTNKFRGLHHIRTQLANAITEKFKIGKWHWEKYQNNWTKSNQ